MARRRLPRPGDASRGRCPAAAQVGGTSWPRGHGGRRPGPH